MSILTPLASDNFMRAAENPLSGGGVWSISPIALGLQIVSSSIVEATALGGYHSEFYNAISWPNDQYCKITLGTLASATHPSNINIQLRLAGSGGVVTYYNCSLTSSNIPALTSVKLGFVYNNNPGTFSTTSGVVFTPGDIWTFVVTGNPGTLSVFQNGTLIATATDPGTNTGGGIASGVVGVQLNVPTGGADNINKAQITNWEGGSVTSSSGGLLNRFSTTDFGAEIDSQRTSIFGAGRRTGIYN